MNESLINDYIRTSDKLKIMAFVCDISKRKWRKPSEPLLKFLSMTEREFSADPEIWISSVPEIYRQKILNQLAGSEKQSSPNSLLIPFLSASGKLTSLEILFSPLNDESDNCGYICSAMDITSDLRQNSNAVLYRDFEIDISSRIQKSLLTGSIVKNLGFLEVAAETLPSSDVDGDFYEFISLADNSLDFIVGDVMGKGVPAALLAAAMKNAFFRALIYQAVVEHDIPSIKGILDEVDRQMSQELISLHKFLTLYYCRIDMDKGNLSFIDAGHTNIIYYSASEKKCWSIKGSNMPMGFLHQQEYEKYDLPLGKGDLLFFYSDGITEVENSEKEQFGHERLEKLILANSEMSPDELVRKVLDVAFYYSAKDFHDDVTVIAFRIGKGRQSIVSRDRYSFRGSVSQDGDALKSALESDLRSVYPVLKQKEVSLFSGSFLRIMESVEKKSDAPLLAGWKIYRDRIVLSVDFSGPDFDWSEENNRGNMSVLLLKGSGEKKKIFIIMDFPEASIPRDSAPS